MLTALLFALAPQTAQTVTCIQARVPKTPIVVALDLSMWKDDADGRKTLEGMIGEKVLFAGTMSPESSIMTVIVEPNDPPVSPQSWRERLAPPGRPFDVQATPCIDASQELAPGMVQSDYHAYFAMRTHAFDVHVSRISEDKEPFPRAEFERIVKSLRVLVLRRGWVEDYPDEIAVPMTVGCVLGADSKEWTEGHLARNADKWQSHFANAELLRYAKVPDERQIAAYEKALALIDTAEKSSPKVRFAQAMLYDGLSLAQYDAKRYADSIAPLGKGYAILNELGRKERASLAYNLACAHALSKHELPALDALKKAIEADPRYRENAAKDTDFDSLRSKPAFKKLIEKPAAEAPLGKS